MQLDTKFRGNFGGNCCAGILKEFEQKFNKLFEHKNIYKEEHSRDVYNEIICFLYHEDETDSKELLIKARQIFICISDLLSILEIDKSMKRI